MTTQHTHPEHGDVDAQAVGEQHVPEMQETPDESTLSTLSTPSTSSVQVEQSSQSNQQEDIDTTANTPVLSALTIPSLLSFAIPIAAATFSTSVEGETNSSSQPNQVNNAASEMPTQAAGDVSVTPDASDSVEPVASVEAVATSEDAPSDVQGDGAQGTEVYALSPEEQMPLEPALSRVAHEAEQEPTSEEQPAQKVQEQPEASTEQDEAMVRPFMEYFEEFRQSEARSLSDAPDAFTEFALSNAAESPTNEGSETSQAGTTAEEVLPPFDFGEGSSFIPVGDESTGSATVNENDASTQSPMEAAVSEENQRVAAVEQEHAENTGPERPVSPLLRRDNRHRPRHGNSAHREEFVRSQGNESPSVESVPAVHVENETQVQATQETQQNEDKNVVETPVETPKPARRYRFDRPAPAVQQGTQRTYGGYSAHTAATNGGSNTPGVTPENTTSSAMQETQSTPVSSSVAQEVSPVTSTTDITNSTPTGVSATSQEEQSLKREAATIEQNATTNVTSTPVPPVEQGRRKHGQERHREKESQSAPVAQTAPVAPVGETAPTSVSDIAALVAETHDALQGDVVPEDLPPLEYADLQKGNARRRRRHRPGQPVTTGTESTRKVQEPQPQIQTQAQAQGTPVVQETEMTPASQHPSAMPVASQNTQSTPSQSTQAATTPYAPVQGNPAYSLTSGFTLGQMNQGNDAAGPFMGPEPSPARGSVFTRDGRTTRSENIRPSSYQPRDNGASGGGPSSASMNHFANVVAQAIQVQSDRMVAEMRRVNQSPTNVSVSLPPFPSTERVGVFVDVANLLYSARTMRISIDFGKLLDFLRGNRRLVRAHAYCPTSPQPGDEQMFLQAVKGLGYRITTKNYKTFASGAKKADLDLDLCMDVVRLVDGHAIDDIVLVSGDSDFMPMLDYCSDHGVRVEIAAFDEAMSATLRQSCDLFVNLSMLEEIRA